MLWPLLVVALAGAAPPGKRVQNRLEELLPQLRRGLQKPGAPRTLAVLDLEDVTPDAKKRALGRAFSEFLAGRLAQERGLQLVERSRMDAVAEELKLGLSGAVDPATAKKVGQLVAAEAVLSGSVSELGGYYDVSVRVVEAQTGRVVAAAVVDVEKDAVAGPVQGRAPDSSQADLDLLESALQAYARGHIEDFQVHWPKALKDLVPKYLDRLPNGEWAYDAKEGRVSSAAKPHLKPTQPRLNLQKMLDEQKKQALQGGLTAIATAMKVHEASSGERPRRLRDLDMDLPKAFGGSWLYDPKTGEVWHSQYPQELRYSPGRP